MPMYGSFDDKFNAALANKLKNQDINAQSGQISAGANLMNAQTQQGLMPSEIGLRSAQGQSLMANAGTERGKLAAVMPMGFNQNQVNSMGLRGFGITPTATANTFSHDLYDGAPGQQSYGSMYRDMQSKYGLSGNPTAAATQPSSATSPSGGSGYTTKLPPNPLDPSNNPFGTPLRFARGGVLGDVEDDTGQDTRKVMARPGEYFLNPETVTHGFGGGNYEHGVRNLDEIVRRSTGREPGATYPKGKAGLAQGGVSPQQYDPSTTADEFRNFVVRNAVGMDPAAQQEWLRRSENVQFAPRRGEVAPVAQHGRSYIDRPDYTDGRDALLARQAAAPAPVNARDQLLARQAEGPGALSANQWNAHIDRLQTGKGGYPMLAAGGQVPGWMTRMSAMIPNSAAWYAMDKFKRARDQAARDAAPPRPITTAAAPEYSTTAGTPQPPPPPPPEAEQSGLLGAYQKLEAQRNAQRAAGMGQPVAAAAAPAPAQPTAATMARFAPPPQPPGLAGELLTPQPTPSLREMAWNAQGRTASDDVVREPEGAGSWNIRNAIQQGGTPGQQMRLDYGAAYGMGPKVAPIVATADKTGRYNSFSGGPGLRNGGRVPGFASGGGYGTPPGSSEPWEIGSGGDPNADTTFAEVPTSAQMQAEADAAKAEAKRTGARWRDVFTDPVGSAKAGGAKAVEAAKAVLPSTKTLGVVGRGVGMAGKLAAPVAIASDAGDVYDVASDPTKTKTDVANEASRKAAKWAAASTLAMGGAALGSFAGPLAPLVSPVLGAAGGLAGYYGAGEGIKGLFGDDPSQSSHGGYSKLMGRGAAAAPTGIAPGGAQPFDQTEAVAALHAQEAAQAQTQGGQPGQPDKPSLRDLMAMRALALGGGGPAAAEEQKTLMNYVGQIDASTSTARYNAMHQAMQMGEEHQKSMSEKLDKMFIKPKLDKDGKDTGQSEPDEGKRNRFVADLAAKGYDVYHMQPTAIDTFRKDWDALDTARERSSLAFAGGRPGQFYTSDRTAPMAVRHGVNFPDVFDPHSTTGLRDWTSAMWSSALGSHGDPNANRMIVQTVRDPITGHMINQTTPATNVLRAPSGAHDLDVERAITAGRR